MKRILKPLGLLLLGAFIMIQFFRPAKNKSSATTYANDISNVYHVPKEVQQALTTSCYDCHSNNTHYPWYSNIQPVAWWLNDHIVEGKKELNFSEFAAYRPRRQYKKMEEIIEQVEEDEMPLSSYTVIHRDAMLTNEQKSTLTDWAKATRDTMKAIFPADSLVRK